MKKQLLIVTELGSFKAYTVDNSRMHTTARLELIKSATMPVRIICTPAIIKIAPRISDCTCRLLSGRP